MRDPGSMQKRAGAAATASGPCGSLDSSAAGHSQKGGKRASKHCLLAVGPDGLPFVVRGQTAKALAELVTASDAGVTALDVASWAFRFSAYCFTLRRKHGLEIETLREDHPGGWHGRHVLRSPVTILDFGQ